MAGTDKSLIRNNYKKPIIHCLDHVATLDMLTSVFCIVPETFTALLLTGQSSCILSFKEITGTGRRVLIRSIQFWKGIRTIG